MVCLELQFEANSGHSAFLIEDARLGSDPGAHTSLQIARNLSILASLFLSTKLSRRTLRGIDLFH